MFVSQSFWIDRITLLAGVRTPVYPPRVTQAVSIGNGTADDVRIYSHSGGDEANHYLVVAAGYERPLSVLKSAFRPDCAAFWLDSTPGGLVVLIWL